MRGDPIATARPVTPAGILAARLAELAGRAAAPDHPLHAELAELNVLAGGLEPYLERHASPPSPHLARLAHDTAARDWAHAGTPELGLEQEMLSGHVEGEFLKMLVHATRARRVLEIGTFTGYATLAMAEALPPDGRLITCEIDRGVAALAADAFASTPHSGQIEVRVGPALATLATLHGPFDMIFLDADKAGYVDYFHALLDGDLLDGHGLLCADNTLMQGQPWTGEDTPNGRAITRFNEVVAADPRVAQVLLPLRDGITLVRRVA